ncbi:multidrug DMT transporter permease [Crenalkalicoccus roseus]|uniref:multidrug DMT transporter permease n=1 Tax=Crenalkalicoccus roseus TaxID=1485588 RepID=UPI001081E8E6|nr:multidrug DMT transporter permease [Crenalkalicoccus roseus]
MRPWFVALLLLSAAGVIEARCSTPGLRPAAPAADRAFRILGRSAFAFWLVLLAWGFLNLPWWQPVAGIVGSLALNALIVRAGARPYWPGLSMGLSLAGLFLTAVVLLSR